MRDARASGIPTLGAGAVWPILLDDILVDPFDIPAHWPRAYALDPGWNRTAALWGAHDKRSDCLYCYTEHYRGAVEPSIHATAIKARGDWIPGVIDPASRGRDQMSGLQIIQVYLDLGLRLTPANNRKVGPDGGLQAVYERLSTGRLKVFRTLMNWQAEYQNYHRDENGKLVEEDDHLMAATRYLVMSGLQVARVQPPQVLEFLDRPGLVGGPADNVAGY